MAKKGIPPTVCNFLHVLSSKLTQYDQKLAASETRRGGRENIYRLGHYLEAAEKVERDVGLPDCHVTLSPAIASTLKESLNRRFNPGFPPAKNVEKQIDAFLTSGKQPSLLGKSRRR